jgi:hypothetical protein
MSISPIMSYRERRFLVSSATLARRAFIFTRLFPAAWFDCVIAYSCRIPVSLDHVRMLLVKIPHSCTSPEPFSSSFCSHHSQQLPLPQNSLLSGRRGRRAQSHPTALTLTRRESRVTATPVILIRHRKRDLHRMPMLGRRVFPFGYTLAAHSLLLVRPVSSIAADNAHRQIFWPLRPCDNPNTQPKPIIATIRSFSCEYSHQHYSSTVQCP